MATALSLANNSLANAQQFHQVNYFPTSLLESIAGTPQTLTKFNFIMSKEQLETNLLPLFVFKSKTYYHETFYDMADHILMENNYWLKEKTTLCKEQEVSIKQHTSQNNQTLTYKVKKCEKKDICINLDMLLKLTKHSFSFSVARTIYELKTNKNVVLTVDMTYYKDLSSFVVLSICGPISNNMVPANSHAEIAQHAKPCRSKIVEYLFRMDKPLYSRLVSLKHVSDMNYKSMCVATFEVGFEKAQNYRTQAEEMKKQMEEEGMDTIAINCEYSNILMYGIVDYPNEIY